MQFQLRHQSGLLGEGGALGYASAVSNEGHHDRARGLRVTLDDLVHQPDVLTPPDRPHCFAYYITIHNAGEEVITIRGRKWVVTEASGDVTAVEGDGVVGETPTLAPGETFSYHSFHVIRSSHARAEGSYLGITEAGEPVVVAIPTFDLVLPEPEGLDFA